MFQAIGMRVIFRRLTFFSLLGGRVSRSLREGKWAGMDWPSGVIGIGDLLHVSLATFLCDVGVFRA